MLEYAFCRDDKNFSKKVTGGLEYFLGGEKPVVLCIGTDLSIGDSLGPIVGTLLYERSVNAFVYGRLSATITAKEVHALKRFIGLTHPSSKALVVDAAIGDKNEVGKVKLSSAPIKPGLGANKDLPELGDVNIIGVVAERSKTNYSFLNLTRLSLVYKMAVAIADGISDYVNRVDSMRGSVRFVR